MVLPKRQWLSFNCVKRYFKIYFILQLVLGDGITVNPCKLKLVTQDDTMMVFPLERPTHSNVVLWKDTIALITPPTFRLSPRLGAYL
jgi:hypothetical protein